MDALFLQVLNMSLTAGYAVLFVLVARLFLKKAPKIFSYALWSVVLFRLICPFSFESLFSLLVINANPIPENIMYAEVPQINTGINLVDNATFLKDGKAISYEEFQEIRSNLINPIKELCSTDKSEKNAGFKLKDYLKGDAATANVHCSKNW